MESFKIDSYNFSLDFLKEINKKKLTIDHFTFIKMIGKGSYSKVALVQKKDNNILYAMKIMKKEFIQKKKHDSRIKEERSILVLFIKNRLNQYLYKKEEIFHPFVIRLDYAFQTDKKLYFVLEYCPGGELFNLLTKRKRFPTEQYEIYKKLLKSKFYN